MPNVTAYQPGTPCWVELSTTDGPAAKTFYTSLFGWETNEMPVGEGEVYMIVRKNGGDVGGMFERRDLNGPPNWATYIAVASADESAAKAKSLGGQIMAEPFDVMDAGRMAVIADPQGAIFSVWQGGRTIGATVVNEPGTLCWNEVMSTDAESARRFYSALFGWTPKVTPEYTEWHLGERPIGGMFEMKGDMFEGVPPHWLPYFAVEDCDRSTRRVTELGGSVNVPPTDIPDVGRFSLVNDPQGASFYIIRLTRPM